MAMIPSGFHFVPSDEELVAYLLHHKETNGSSYQFICEKQIYGDEATPWLVFDESQTNWIESGMKKRKTTYVISKPCKVSNKRISRVAGCGTWEGKSMTNNLKDSEGRVIGKKRQFSFKPRKEFKESEAKGKGHWIMHELSLHGYDYVICRIIKDLSKE